LEYPVSDEQSPLSRWSQRKLAARRGEEIAAEPKPYCEPELQEVPAPASKREPPLPALEDLTSESDYTAFLAKDVPEALTRAALRKLWTSDPVLANLDGLNHYDEDYNVIDKAITLAQTGYHPERGYLDALADEAEATPSDAVRGKSVAADQTEVAIVSNSDAPVDSEPDAPRQVAAAVADAPDAKLEEEPSK
jgi:hypothetical protein